MIFENASKVSFWCGQSPTVLNIVKLQKSFIGVFNGYFKARNFLTPLLDSMPSLVTASVESSEEEFHHCFALLSCEDGCTREETFSVVLEGLSAATNLELTSDDLVCSHFC